LESENLLWNYFGGTFSNQGAWHNGESGTLAFHIIRVLFQQDLEAGMADEGCHLGSMAQEAVSIPAVSSKNPGP